MNIRIEKIAGMVRKGMVVADIGTDHAFLPVLLARNGISPKIYACDVAEGPLNSAKETIAKYGLEDCILPILSDGFENVPEDAQVAVIAGMGFYTARDILEAAMDRVRGMKQVVVEVNRNVREMRQWISDHHFTIDDEAMVEENGFWYAVISFTPAYHDAYSEAEVLCGPVLLERKEPEFLQFCRKQTERIDFILSKTKKESVIRELTAERGLWENAQKNVQAS